MDDVERVEKINAMTQELKKFGFFDNSNEAVEGAKNIMLSDEQQKESKIFTSEEEILVELSNSFKRFKEMTATRIQEMSRNIINLHAQIKEITETVSTLQTRKEISPREKPSPEIPKEENPHSPQEPEEKPLPKKQPESQERSEKPYYEKQGYYTPEDVKVEDFFYYGKK